MNQLKKLFAPVDMTVGKPWEDIVIFTVPMLIGNIAQQLYNTVDSVVVGRFVGDNALAAVGSAGPILNLLIVLFVGISVGAGIMVSQYLGARNREALSMTIGTCIVLTGIASLLVMVFATVAVRPMLELLNTPESIIGWCTSYLRILFIGVAGCAYYNILSGILRGLGDSMSALLYLLVASGLNIVLDLFFVVKMDMGVSGVALATAIAQGVSALLCLLRLTKLKDLFELKWKYIRLFKSHVKNIIRLGVPSGLTQAIMSMSMLVVQSLTNSFGEIFIAANVIVMRVDGFAMMPNFSFGTAMTTYAGQNVGAGKYDRVVKGASSGNGGGYRRADPCIRKAAYADIYRYAGACEPQYEYDAYSGSGLHSGGSDADSFRRDARGGRHDDAHVDIHGINGSDPRAAGLRACVSDEDAAAPPGRESLPVCLARDILGAGSADYRDLL